MANLEKALKKCLKWEGGYANDPDDTGGPSMRGVTIATYREYCRRVGKPVPTVNDLKKISYEEIVDLADKLFWSKIMGNRIKNQSIANLCFDSVWGSGLGYIKVIQRVLGVQVDGIFGPNTLAKMNNWNPQSDLFERLWKRRKTYFEGCSTAWKYLNGWMNRLRSFTFGPEFEQTAPSVAEVSEPDFMPDTVTAKTDPFQNSSAEENSAEPQHTETQEVEQPKRGLLTIIIEFFMKLFHIDMA